MSCSWVNRRLYAIVGGFMMSLHVADYVVFVGALVFALGIGVYYALTGDRQRTTGQYLLGNRKMSLLPVTISMMVTYISTLTLMGYPTEVFAYGVQYCLGSFSGAVGIVLASYVFLPVFYPLKLTSVNEVRFSRSRIYTPWPFDVLSPGTTHSYTSHSEYFY